MFLHLQGASLLCSAMREQPAILLCSCTAAAVIYDRISRPPAWCCHAAHQTLFIISSFNLFQISDPTPGRQQRTAEMGRPRKVAVAVKEGGEESMVCTVVNCVQ